MKRYIPGLSQANVSSGVGLLNGFLLVRVARLQYRWYSRKPCYLVLFTVLEPKSLAGKWFTGRFDCTPKALWKLNWFLRDFGYDIELLGRNEVDDRSLVGLSGVVKITHAVVNGAPVLNLDGFAPNSRWEEISSGIEDQRGARAAS